MMKSYFLIALLAALAGWLDAAAIEPRSNPPVTAGTIQPGDWVMMSGESMARGQPDFVSTMTLRYTLAAQYKVNAVRITEQGTPQGGAPAFVGGVGTNEVTVILVSARGKGFVYRIELWGHDTTGADTGPNRPTVRVAQW